MKKNVNIPMNTVLPVTDEFIMDLLTADTVNGRIFYYMEEEGGEGYSTDMWLDYFKSYGCVTKPAQDVYGGIIIRPLDKTGVEAVLLEKK